MVLIPGENAETNSATPKTPKTLLGLASLQAQCQMTVLHKKVVTTDVSLVSRVKRIVAEKVR